MDSSLCRPHCASPASLRPASVLPSQSRTRQGCPAPTSRQVRRNGGTAGVDGETFSDIEEYGVESWLGELARELKEGSYAPRAVRQVLIPKKQLGKWRALGIPCLRDRVVQSSAMLVLSPIFEADLQPEQYAYRAQRSANDAVKRVHSLLNTVSNVIYRRPCMSPYTNVFLETPPVFGHDRVCLLVPVDRFRCRANFLDSPAEQMPCSDIGLNIETT